jgi:hypothetical protein
MDWFICENGIIGCESTIGDINYNPEFGAPYYCRIRQAMQYGNSLDDYVKIMLENNAGDYPCSWFLGDTKRKEIMIFELAFKTHSVERKREGVFYGVNSVMDPKMRKKETVDKDEQNDLEELYLLWDEAIQLFESEEFPGDYDQLNKDVENWYTYRSIISERLELVMNLLAMKEFDINL